MNVPVLKQLSENKEFIYAVILILLIPGAFIANTFLFVRGLNNAFDTELTSKANLATSVLASTLKESFEDKEKLAAALEEVTKNSPEIEGLTIVSFEQGIPIILATNEEELALSTESVLLTKLAWKTGQPYTTKLEVLNENAEPIRLWQVSLPVPKEADQEQDRGVNEIVRGGANNTEEEIEMIAVINLKVSGEKSDILISNLERNSVIFTLITLFVIVLLMLNHFRFFGYARLFQKLKEVDEMKDNFISLASHELRTPVTALRGFSSLAVRKIQKGHLQAGIEDLNMVNKSAENINELVNDLLDVSRIENKRLKLDIKPTDLRDVLSNVVQEIQVQANQKGLIFTYYKPNKPLIILGDSQKLKQVFVNLIGNAIKYTPRGKVTLSHEVVGNKVKTFIEDSGMGIPAEEMPNLFEKFHRVQNKQTSQIRGTGLGLWITKQLIEMMRGKILIESIQGRGTNVIVVFSLTSQREG